MASIKKLPLAILLSTQLLAGAITPSHAAPAALAVTPAARLAAGDVQALLEALSNADRHGLAADAELPPAARAMLASPDAAVRTRGEAMLLDASIRFARAMRGGRLAAGAFRTEWHIRPPAYDARASVADAIAQGRLAPWLEGLAPSHSGYGALLPELARYRMLAQNGGWPTLDVRSTLKAGAADDAVAALRARLVVEGFVAPAAVDKRVFDAGLEAALARFQRTRGLSPDGIAGRATIQALNVPVDARLAAIEANLERWRWTPRSLPGRRVEVNIAAAELQAFDAGRPTLAMRTVVGRPADPTPMFADQIESVVFNPPWNVPAGIAAKEILPKARRDPSYLARQGFVFIQDGGARRLQQKAGPTSALGLFKFDLPNPYSVFLHDTPVRTVFAGDRRALSHGCIRLQQPRDLAIWALRGTPAWDPAAIDVAVATGDTSSARLAAPLPVYLFYWTAFVGADGELNFRDDIYAWDRALVAALR